MPQFAFGSRTEHGFGRTPQPTFETEVGPQLGFGPGRPEKISRAEIREMELSTLTELKARYF